jgi:hypothetical protein
MLVVVLGVTSRLSMRLRIMKRLLGTAFLLISPPCFAADNIPPVGMGGPPPVYGAPMYGGPVYGGPVLPAYRGYGGPVYGGPVLPALPAYRGYGGPVYGGPVLPALPAYRGYGGPVYRGPVYGGPMDGVTPIH